jgi:hypothetical protein
MLIEETITMSDRKAGVSHAKNLMAMKASKNLEEVLYFESCYEALRQETLQYRKRTSRSTCNFTQDEFFLLTDAIVAETYPSKNFILLRENAWVFKQCYFLNDARKLRLLATPGKQSATQIYDMDVSTVMSATAHNLLQAEMSEYGCYGLTTL